MTTLKQITDKLIATFSESNLNAITLKVAAEYNDETTANSLISTPPVIKDMADMQSDLFADSDRAFIDSFASVGLGIADDVAREVVEGFNT